VHYVVYDNKRMKKLASDLLRIFSMQLAIVLILTCLVVVGYLCRKRILITYHRWGIQSSLKAMRWAAKPTSGEKFRRQSERLTGHQKALISLGYLEERTFHTEHIKMNSPQTEKIFAEFRERYPRASYTVSWGQALTITDRPERMPTWEALVRKYDVPPEEPGPPIATEEQPEAAVVPK